MQLQTRTHSPSPLKQQAKRRPAEQTQHARIAPRAPAHDGATPLFHGVRVLEFQTPAYERRVLYANQPLPPADTLSLLDAPSELRMEAPADPRPVETETAPGVRSGRIARMRDFDVHRFVLEAGAASALPRAPYGVLVGVAGAISCGGVTLGAEQAALLSGQALLRRLEAGEGGGTALLTTPR